VCSAREIVYLNASDKIVGIEKTETNSTGGWGSQLPYMIAHPELMSLPIVGDARTNVVNYEEIAKLKPMLSLLLMPALLKTYNPKQEFQPWWYTPWVWEPKNRWKSTRIP
jgi:hypothetical protein